MPVLVLQHSSQVTCQGEPGYTELAGEGVHDTASLPSPLQHDVEAEGRKLTKEICDAYTGADKPPACHSSYWLH